MLSGAIQSTAGAVDASRPATWIVAVSGAQSAASIELATGAPVMAMGGFSGTDAAPTLDQLQATWPRAGSATS